MPTTCCAPEGPRWTDLEDARAGSVEWDPVRPAIDPRRVGVPAGIDEAPVAGRHPERRPGLEERLAWWRSREDRAARLLP